MHFITGGPLQRGPGAIAPVALPLNPALAATLHTYTAIITSHSMHVQDVLYNARRCTATTWIYDSFDDCWFAKHCTTSVIWRPRDFQKL